MNGDIKLWKIVRDKVSEQLYLWNSFFGYSVWLHDLCPEEDLRDSVASVEKIWTLYKNLQRSSVFLQCYVCSNSIALKEAKQCSRCFQIVHFQCYHTEFSSCRFCAPKTNSSWNVNHTLDENYLQKEGHMRLRTILDEFSHVLQSEFVAMNTDCDIQQLRSIAFRHFQRSFVDFVIQPISNKRHTLGVVAAKNVKPFTRICIYPGYRDVFAGYQCKYGRQIPRYSVEIINCAGLSNHVFDEFTDISGPFINEPSLFEMANCGWIREKSAASSSRYSVITVKEVLKGQEFLVSYGPEYRRDYDYAYDHYVFLPSDSVQGRQTYALFRWQSKVGAEPLYISRIVYCEETDVYTELAI